MRSLDRGERFNLIESGGLSYILYYVTTLAFDILVFFSFIGRVEARKPPVGFWENIYPLASEGNRQNARAECPPAPIA